jgi:hypothetical protein
VVYPCIRYDRHTHGLDRRVGGTPCLKAACAKYDQASITMVQTKIRRQ